MNEPTPDELNDVANQISDLGSDEQTHRLIVWTVAKLPKDVKYFVYEHCTFVSVGGADRGLTLPARVGLRQDPDGKEEEYTHEDAWLLILADVLPKADAMA